MADSKTFLNILSVVMLLVLWDMLVRFGVYRFHLLPSPGVVLDQGLEWAGGKDFWIDLSLTTLRVFGGLITACAIAIPLGLMIGWNSYVSDLTFPVVEILRPIPGIAYIPIAIHFLPSEEASTAFIFGSSRINVKVIEWRAPSPPLRGRGSG
jgi:NitT/TauT family transport system permease protein